MKLRIDKKNWMAAAFIFLLAAAAYAEAVDISGKQIPLIEGASLIKSDSGRTKEARVATYAVDRDIDTVTTFYRMYFYKNDFFVIGGDGGGDFNVSVKKDNVMFSVKVYRENERTLIQFIW